MMCCDGVSPSASLSSLYIVVAPLFSLFCGTIIFQFFIRACCVCFVPRLPSVLPFPLTIRRRRLFSLFLSSWVVFPQSYFSFFSTQRGLWSGEGAIWVVRKGSGGRTLPVSHHSHPAPAGSSRRSSHALASRWFFFIVSVAVCYIFAFGILLCVLTMTTLNIN